MSFKESGGKQNAILKERNDAFSEMKDRICPRCGSELITAKDQTVVSKYPAPALEAVSCSKQGCNYHKYVKAED